MTKKTDTPEPQLPSVLLVDDDQDFLAIFSKTLESWGYSVMTAEDGRAALELIDSSDSQWLALITDFNMPLMTGGELIRAVHIRGVPFYTVILFSSVSVKETEVATLQSGIGGEVPFYFMSKPIQSAALKKVLEEAVEKARTQPEL